MPALTPSARAAAAVTLGAVAAYYYFQCHYRPRRRAAAAARRFHRDGIAVVRGFASASECREMLASMDTLVEAWDPAETTSVFRTDASQSVAQGKDDYFITSADAVRFFLEPGAMDEVSGALLVPKQEALNKVGHALHVYVPAFARYAQSPKVRALVASLGWRAPDLVQSMYIFKQPRIGGEVTPHQDSCFLRTDPPTCLGLWLALEDATLENGCLWARPGSHTEPIRRHFAKQPDGTMGFEERQPARAWPSADGRMPEEATPTSLGFTPLPCSAGDLVLIHGQVDHLSLPNTSGKSRHTFQLHMVEGETAGAKWHPKNWLQYPAGKPFPTFT